MNFSCLTMKFHNHVHTNAGWTPLHSAAENGHFMVWQTIVMLVQEKDPVCNNGWTPLMLITKHRKARRLLKTFLKTCK